ncbi:hypothetical protein TBLA_0D04350 [Henningerozyma blattae CBS 6284]|uniref:ABC transporter domain-containing protein n=1 Tax=Henningerozyma blattae (strain ATCC 34711 / CBS 6284 / DSM 70876 / NBRC 10599 / NRRL Y-10934 / UCD 77-7) TaxID=1071380 RepID=I2H3H9_HENB6|nr:hypothetical protein TBLA_0D04350 [Tetrapisispora blattae CBS 6284]CCH60931.1 hypothetical protein TBLA_0D04350 [Tetrapisispora blattae CBS 6284]
MPNDLVIDETWLKDTLMKDFNKWSSPLNTFNRYNDNDDNNFNEFISLTRYNNRNNNTDNDKCPPCFNCMLPIFECKQFSECNPNTGRCDCREGFAGDDCLTPLCGSLADDNSNRPMRSNETNTCKGQCDDGWSGINCNICEMDSVCDSFMPDSSIKGTCYRNGMIVNRVFEGCNVTNEKIIEILNGKLPQISFSCDKKKQECNFQFWIDEIESFYCGLDACTFEYDLNKNTTHYNCENAKCKCVPGTMLCGKNGSIDISEFLTETIKGPGDFTCDLNTHDCQFTEPSMNDLILTIFGDPYITLNCQSGECLHFSEIPGYKSPTDREKMTWSETIILTLTALAVLTCATLLVLYIANSPLFKTSSIHLSDDEDDDMYYSNEDVAHAGLNGTTTQSFTNKLTQVITTIFGLTAVADTSIQGRDDDFLTSKHVAALSFENISYNVPSISDNNSERDILKNVSGIVKPGEIMAILGGSGAGKTTLLDILAFKRKSGHVSGDIKINGKNVSREIISKMIGFVDQDDFLFPTLTVYEAVLNSALLRLPNSMTFYQKQQRVFQVLEELRIYNIKDRLIGDDFERGISGGEKRRVSIACELVTSPLILFLDEPTSGLDSNNANNVVECLVRLAKNYNRTLVLTIHQPRSNIFHLFSKLVLLSSGEMVYSGEIRRVGEFLKTNGYRCPTDYNIADYLIDLTFDKEIKSVDFPHRDLEEGLNESSGSSTSFPLNTGINFGDDINRFKRTQTQLEWEHFAGHRDELSHLLTNENTANDSANIQQQSKIGNRKRGISIGKVNTQLLHTRFKEGAYFMDLNQEISEVVNQVPNSSNSNSTSTLSFEIPDLQRGASFLQQLLILCSRTFKNVYRNPKLLLANYILTILLSIFLGTLYYDVANNISGFQNRMGLFFFILTYFGFITFTGLSSFAQERNIFIKERSNNYYSPIAYYISKILSEIIPLRVFPPILLSVVIYPMVGLNMRSHAFFKCILILISFNTAIALQILTIGIVVKDLNSSIILSVLVLLGSLLFSGLFINTQEITNFALKYFKNISIFYYAYESLLINEVKTLILKEKKYGLNIEVPGATILSTFGFIVQNLYFDIKILSLFNVIFLILGYLGLKFIVVEQK